MLLPKLTRCGQLFSSRTNPNDSTLASISRLKPERPGSVRLLIE